MKKIESRALSLIFSFIILISAVQPAFAAAPAVPAKNSTERHQVCTSLSDAAEDYYTGDYSYDKLSSLRGAASSYNSQTAAQNNELYNRLHRLMSSTQTYNTSYSGKKAGSLAYYWEYTDSVSDSPTYVMFYTDFPGADYTMNREHVWPKSRASYYQKNGGSDLHHLRPSVGTLNTAKSDHAFGYVKDCFSEGYKTGNIGGEDVYWLMTSADLFECKDDVKGDVARILLYVYCRWEQPNLYSDVTNGLPELDPDDNNDSGKAVIESLDTLLMWCEDDPVDTWEMTRNDLTQQVQGNRNVFIDYPELAWKMFGRSVPTGLTTPTKDGCEHSWETVDERQPTDSLNGYKKLHCDGCGEDRTFKLYKDGSKYTKDFPDVKESDWFYDVVNYAAEKGYIKGYQDGNFGPNDNLKRQDFVCILARIDGADLKAYENVQSKLTDVKKGDYYAAAVNWAVDKGYISGYQNGKFGVNDSITREQVATILYNYMGKPEVENAEKILSKFPDANKVSSFAKTPVAWAVDKGIISGMGNGTVASTSGATRAQIAAIIQRMDTQGMFVQ